jgi:hypothetical protein
MYGVQVTSTSWPVRDEVLFSYSDTPTELPTITFSPTPPLLFSHIYYYVLPSMCFDNYGVISALSILGLPGSHSLEYDAQDYT